ncbi:unnamed protein product [Penicillium bialowiezense]
MSTLEEALSQRHRLSVWHVYREGFDHISVTPFLVPGKEYGGSSDDNRSYESYFQKPNGYFVHLPSLLFHNPPRTLRRGHKKGDPICTIKLGAFWNEWIVQFSGNLKNAIDPRGLVKWECRSNLENSTSNDIREWKGYKVRTWRVWGETGAEYHRTVNARRKAIKEEVTEVRAVTAADKCKARDLEMGPVESENGVPSGSQSQSVSENTSCPGSQPAAVPLPTVADEAFRLKWSSPLSIRTRTYCFEYAGIEFSWEGTRDVHYNHMWNKRLMPFNHLKLVARVPGSMEETYVAQYTSSFSHDKHGQLWIFDSVVTELLERTGHPSKWIKQTETKERFCLDINWDVQQTRLYDMIVATSMCMIIGERQKEMIEELDWC